MAHPWLTFELDDAFVESYQKLRAPFGSEVGEATFWRTYSRSDNPRLPLLPHSDVERVMETWTDVCRRVVEGMHTVEMEWCNSRGIPYNMDKAQEAAQEAFDLMFNFKWTPPGRGLSHMGTANVHVHELVEVLQNCAFVSTATDGNAAEPYAWLMLKSMLGVGVGFDTLGAGRSVFKPLAAENPPWLIPDTREGWAQSVQFLINSYLYPSIAVQTFDYSNIRPFGAPIRTFGGTASGPEALRKCHDDLRAVFDANANSLLTSKTIVDAMNIIGVAVVSGNARRSAELALGLPEDNTFTNLKNPEGLGAERPWGWMSNNSVYADLLTDYSVLAKLTWATGEPGYFWYNNASQYGRMNGVPAERDRVDGANPCMEQQLENKEMCTLTDIYLPNVKEYERRKVVKHAYRYAKIVTLLSEKIDDPISRQVMMKNRRIGLSVTGASQVYSLRGRDYLIGSLSEMYDYVQRYDGRYSQWYGVPRSIRKTSVKPSGTTSLLADVTPGAHFAVAGPYYIRRVNMPKGSLLAGYLGTLGYPVEDSAYTQGSVVVSFPTQAPRGAQVESRVGLAAQVDLMLILAEYWADNMVSVTLKFHQEHTSADDIAELLSELQTKVKGVALLPLNSGVYPQMPFEEITKKEYWDMRGKIERPFHINWRPAGLHEIDEKFCDGQACEVAIAEGAN